MLGRLSTPSYFFIWGTAAVGITLSVMFLIFAVDPAHAATTVDSLGNTSPGFDDGATPDIIQLLTAQSGQPDPFDMVEGNDLIGPNFSASWTHTYAAIPAGITAASITIALAGQDSAAAGTQVSSFDLDGTDLTELMNAELDGHGGAPNEYNVYTLALPTTTFANLEDGTATWSLDLQGPTSGGPFNGARIFFPPLAWSRRLPGRSP